MADVSALMAFTTQIAPEIVAVMGTVSVSKVRRIGNWVYKVTYHNTLSHMLSVANVSALIASITQIGRAGDCGCNEHGVCKQVTEFTK